MTTLRAPVAATLPRARPALAAAWAVLGVLALAALWPDLLATAPPDAVDPASALAPIGPDHPFGTDQLGRDVYSRVVHGARLSLLIGLGATTIAVSVGALLGVLAATAGRVADEVLMRVTDVLLAFPGLLLALLVIAVLGPGRGRHHDRRWRFAAVPGLRPARPRPGPGGAASRGTCRRPSCSAGAGCDLPEAHVPNALPPVLVFATVGIGTALMASTSLSFLGLGAQPPTPEWGAMLAEGRDYLDLAWGLAVFPGVVVTVTVIALLRGRPATCARRFEGQGAWHGHVTWSPSPACTSSAGVGRPVTAVHAVRGVAFTLRAGECLADGRRIRVRQDRHRHAPCRADRAGPPAYAPSGSRRRAGPAGSTDGSGGGYGARVGLVLQDALDLARTRCGRSAPRSPRRCATTVWRPRARWPPAGTELLDRRQVPEPRPARPAVSAPALRRPAPARADRRRRWPPTRRC